MANNVDWIQADDSDLKHSIIRHEGDLNAIIRLVESGRIKVADGCDFAHCKATNTWPAYVDSLGYDTVGVGHLITRDEDYDCYAGVTQENVENQLAADMQTHLKAAKKLAQKHQMDIGSSYVVQRFMTELCFNIGATGYSKFKNGLKKLSAAVNGGRHSYNEAADEHLDSKWARDVGQRAIEMVDTLRALD